MRQSITGPITVQRTGRDACRFIGAAGIKIYLRSDALLEDSALAAELPTSAVIEWSDGGAAVELNGAHGTRTWNCRSAIVHRPEPNLYASLPLAVLDPDVRRFWRGVFRLMRIPGGRLLLALMARLRASKLRRA